MRYDAVSVKVRAMWGKRLTAEDYRRLSVMRSLPELVNVLRSHEGWSGAFEALNPNQTQCGDVELALRWYATSKHLKLFPYLSHSDHDLMRYPVLQVELEQIMQFMRLASINRAHEYNFTLPAYFDRYSKIKYSALSSAVTYDDMLSAVSGADFYPILHALRTPDGRFPEYLTVEIAMRNYHYKTLLALINRQSLENVRISLRDAVGLQIDLYNICSILRVKKYYPHLESNIVSYLLPCGRRLNAPFIKQLYSAPDEESILRLLLNTPYGKYFTQTVYPYIEICCSEIMYEYFKRRIAMESPSIFIPFAYLFLDDIELQNIIHLIECVWYGLPAEKTKEYLVGI